ncbi:MAG: YbaN family protein [Micrococcaceae bacterium]
MLGKQIVFFSIGIIASCLGIIGAILPLIPGAPMIVLALWAFSKSSQRIHDWLMSFSCIQKTQEEMLHFKHDRSLSIVTKISSIVTVWVSCTMVYFLIGEPWAVATIAFLALCCSIFMLSVPTRYVKKSAVEIA